MKKWKVDKQLKNEAKWLKDYHLACLKNKSQAALKLELFQTALDASESALAIDAEDHKAWYRKVQAEKGLGKFKEAEVNIHDVLNLNICNIAHIIYLYKLHGPVLRPATPPHGMVQVGV